MFTGIVSAQVNPDRITIARDNFGVPHIFAPTDPEVAYGLAWAHAEDDFNTLQMVILSGKAKLSTVSYPKNGLPIIESINTFGASLPLDSPHFNDQLPLFF